MDTVELKVYVARKLPSKSKGEITPLEIRRFSTLVPETYASLSESVENFLPSLKGLIYSIYWRDEDGDFIHLASNLEVVNAVQVMRRQSPVLKIYVIQQDVTGEAHETTQCDGCNVIPIVGPRFKCLQCPDFDLCRSCENRGVHSEHIMIRFVKPVVPSCGSIFSRSYAHYLKKQKQLYSSESSDSDDAGYHETGGEKKCSARKKHSHCERRSKHGHHGHHREDKHRDEEWGERRRGHRHSHGNHDQDMRREYYSLLKCANKAAATAVDTITAITPEGRHFDYLKNLGVAFTRLVDPLGDIADRQNQGNPPATNAGAGASETTPITTPTASGPQEEANRDTSNLNQPMSAESSSAQYNNAAAAKTVPQSNTPIVVAATAGTPSAENFPPMNISGFPTIYDVLGAAVQDLSSNLDRQHIEAPDWTMVDANASVQEQPPRHPDPQVQRGLGILQAMGFNNSSGVITRILEGNNGDLNKTLDILIPKKK